jgi:maltose O-acetyltransferase
MILWLANILSFFMPQTRCFGVRRFWYRMAGVDIASTVRMNGTSRIHFANVSIGKETWVGAGCQFISTLTASVRIGSSCDIGPEVMFVVGSHEVAGPTRRAGGPDSRAISIGSGTWIGARALFLSGSSVGEGCVVAAGSVVATQFPDNVLLGGVPARIIRQLDG